MLPPHLPDVAEGKVDEDPRYSDHLELKVRGDLEVHPLREILRSTNDQPSLLFRTL